MHSVCSEGWVRAFPLARRCSLTRSVGATQTQMGRTRGGGWVLEQSVASKSSEVMVTRHVSRVSFSSFLFRSPCTSTSLARLCVPLTPAQDYQLLLETCNDAYDIIAELVEPFREYSALCEADWTL